MPFYGKIAIGKIDQGLPHNPKNYVCGEPFQGKLPLSLKGKFLRKLEFHYLHILQYKLSFIKGKTPF